MGSRHFQASRVAELGAGGEPADDRCSRMARLYRIAAVRGRHFRIRVPARPRCDGREACRRRHAAAHGGRLLCVAHARVQSQHSRVALLGGPALGIVAGGGAAGHPVVGAGRRARGWGPLRQAHDRAAARYARGLDRLGPARVGVSGNARAVDRPRRIRLAGGAAGAVADAARFRAAALRGDALWTGARRRPAHVRPELAPQSRGHVCNAGDRRTDRAAPPNEQSGSHHRAAPPADEFARAALSDRDLWCWPWRARSCQAPI
jgi:hypothetical protein